MYQNPDEPRRSLVQFLNSIPDPFNAQPLEYKGSVYRLGTRGTSVVHVLYCACFLFAPFIAIVPVFILGLTSVTISKVIVVIFFNGVKVGVFASPTTLLTPIAFAQRLGPLPRLITEPTLPGFLLTAVILSI